MTEPLVNAFVSSGQFHEAKKFVITKIIFVITNISNFVFFNIYSLPIAIYKLQIFSHILMCK